MPPGSRGIARGILSPETADRRPDREGGALPVRRGGRPDGGHGDGRPARVPRPCRGPHRDQGPVPTRYFGWYATAARRPPLTRGPAAGGRAVRALETRPTPIELPVPTVQRRRRVRGNSSRPHTAPQWTRERGSNGGRSTAVHPCARTSWLDHYARPMVATPIAARRPAPDDGTGRRHRTAAPVGGTGRRHKTQALSAARSPLR